MQETPTTTDQEQPTDLPAHRGGVRYLRSCGIISLLLLIAAACIVPMDRSISDTLRFSPAYQDNHPLSTVIEWVKIFGKGDVLILLAFTLGACGMKRRALAVLAALLISTILVWPLKMSVQRDRPRGNSTVSFPSGDAAAIAAFSVPLVVGAPLAIPAAGGLVAGVAFGRVYHGAHYPSDVLTGAAVGLIAGVLAVLLVRRITFRVEPRHFLAMIAAFLAGWLALSRFIPPSGDFIRFLKILLPLLAVGICVKWVISRKEARRGKKLSKPTRTDLVMVVLSLSASLLLLLEH